MKDGTIVKVHDGSYSWAITGKGLQHTSGNELMALGKFIVIATGCDLPADDICDNQERNNTVIKSITSGLVVFIQERFLTPVHLCNVCPNCGKSI